MTNFTGQDAFDRLLTEYTYTVEALSDVTLERDHLQEKVDALEAKGGEEPEDYVSSKDFYDLSKRYDEMTWAHDLVHKEFEDLQQKLSRAHARITALQKDIGNLTLENTDLKSARGNPVLDEQSIGYAWELGKDVVNLKAELNQTTESLNEANRQSAYYHASMIKEISKGTKLFEENVNLKNTIGSMTIENADLKATIEDLRKDTGKWTHPDQAAFDLYQKLRGR